MTKSTITREQLEEWVSQFDEDGGCDATDRQLEALIRQSLAAMDSSESVELPLDYLQGHKDGLEWAAQLAEANHPETGDWLYDDPIELAKAIRKGPDMPPVQPVADSEPVAEVLSNRPGNDTSTIDRALPVGTQLYRHAQPASEREQVRREHAEWSQATFGNVGPVGPLKHLSKEALEAAAEPGDLSEWADMQFLLWDAQRRAGITDDQITQAMIDKLAVNKRREWPEPKDGEPRLHIKGQPAPVVPDGYVMVPFEPNGDMLAAAQDAYGETDGDIASTLRAAMLAAAPQLPGSEPAAVPGKWIPVSERMPEREVDVQVYCPDKKEQMVAYLESNELEGYFRFATWRTGDGIYCQPTHWMQLPAAPQEVKP
nr:dATP/dGTP pyrophosphohydrolase domain-containing protein [Klebsiella quasipneumoniae]